MTANEQRDIRLTFSVLNHAKQSGNVSKKGIGGLLCK